MAGIKVTTTKHKSKEITKFPCIGVTPEVGVTPEGADGELIVLFTNNSKGTVLQSDAYEVGDISSQWKIELFTHYTGTVKLINK